MDTIVNPIKTSVKTVGRAVSSDTLVDGLGKVFKSVSQIKSAIRVRENT
jgi:hypothetical protein